MSRHKLKTGEALLVESARPDDAAEILQFLRVAAGESETLASGPEDFDLPVEEERAWLRHQAELPTSVALCGKAEGRVVALASLAAPTRRRIAHTGELGVVVSRAYWNKGVGAAMLDELLRFARATCVLRLLHLGVRADNAAAIALYRKFGFAETGRYPGFFREGGQACDQLVMCLPL